MKKLLIILILLSISLSLLGSSGLKEKLEAKIELINVSSEVKVF